MLATAESLSGHLASQETQARNRETRDGVLKRKKHQRNCLRNCNQQNLLLSPLIDNDETVLRIRREAFATAVVVAIIAVQAVAGRKRQKEALMQQSRRQKGCCLGHLDDSTSFFELPRVSLRP
jgi:hypothetical protein